MRISDWSSDVCSSDLVRPAAGVEAGDLGEHDGEHERLHHGQHDRPQHAERGPLVAGLEVLAGECNEHGPVGHEVRRPLAPGRWLGSDDEDPAALSHVGGPSRRGWRSSSEEHTSELPSLMRTSYAVFCLKNYIYLS